MKCCNKKCNQGRSCPALETMSTRDHLKVAGMSILKMIAHDKLNMSTGMCITVIIASWALILSLTFLL